ncbi:MAG: hypothetical protein ACLR3S_11265 [Clostridium fessum]
MLYILNRLGMSGEKGGDDILRICECLHNNGRPISQVSIGQLCELLSDAPKTWSSVSAVRSRSACRTWHIWVLRIS